MRGDVTGLWWKPRIDVIGRTKFWFRPAAGAGGDNGTSPPLRVYYYDEEWEIPAFRALLQIVTPGEGFSLFGSK